MLDKIFDNKYYRNVLLQAIKKWKIPSQFDMVIEEMAELTQALLHDRRKTKDCHLCRIKDEFADVLICLYQLELILKFFYQLNPNEFDSSMEKRFKEKIIYLEDLIKNDSN